MTRMIATGPRPTITPGEHVSARPGAFVVSTTFESTKCSVVGLATLHCTWETTPDPQPQAFHSTSAYHSNQQYSVYAITNATGAVSERMAYTAYGQPTFLNAAGTVQTSSANNNRYTYTGREWDASLKLHHFRARWMSPISGRFVTRDLIGYSDGANVYQYCAGMSTRSVDPSGFESFIPGPTVGGVPYPWILPGTHLPGHPHSAPPPPYPSSPEGYAESVCWGECCHLRGLGITGIWGAEATGGWVQNEAQEYADQFHPRLSRENSALRHCVASGMLASRFGCSCSQCLVDMRDVAQWYRGDQPWPNTQQALYNDREGRDCAGCRGNGRTGGPLLYYSSDAGVQQCCRNKLGTKKLYTGNPTTGIPSVPMYPTVFPRFPTPDWWYPSKQPRIAW